MIKRIYTRLWGQTEEESEGKLSDRKILNVFRRSRSSNETMLKTKEVAEALPITREWTHQRLEDLEEEGRVKSRNFSGVDVWRLSPTETETPVPDGAFDLGWWSFHTYESAVTSYRFGSVLLMVGGLILIPTFFLLASAQVSTFLFHEDVYAAAAMAAAVTASFFFIGGGVVHPASLILRYRINSRDN